MKWAFRNKRTGRFRACRLSLLDNEDPIMAYSGCSEEFAIDFRKRDLKEGCPRCTAEVAENASEPDVMQRMDLR